MNSLDQHATQTLAPGTVLFNEGDPGETMFLLVRGKMEVLKQVTADATRVLGILSPGDYFGEMSLLNGVRRSATVRAVEESELREITIEGLNSLILERPDLAVDLMRQISDRLFHANEEIILLSLEMALLQRRPEALSSFSHHMVFVATGTFDIADTRQVVDIAQRNAEDLKHIQITSSLLRLGRGDDAIIYVVETDRYADLLKMIAPFTGLVKWEITPAVRMDDENITDIQAALQNLPADNPAPSSNPA